jgi:phage shock protein C
MAPMDNEEKDIGGPKRRRFYRSRESRIISGFCGGLGDYFNIDPLLMRLGFIALVLFNPAGIGMVLFYIIGVLVTPLEPKS